MPASARAHFEEKLLLILLVEWFEFSYLQDNGQARSAYQNKLLQCGVTLRLRVRQAPFQGLRSLWFALREEELYVLPVPLQ